MAKRTLFADIAGVFSGNIVAMASTLLLSILLSRTLGPSGYGVYSSLFAVVSMVMGIALMGMGRSAVFHLGRKIFDDNLTVSSILVMQLITGSLSMLAAGIAYYVMHDQAFKWYWIVLILCMLPFLIGNYYQGGIFMGKEQIQRANRLMWLPTTINLLLSAILVWGLKLGITGALVAVLLSTLSVNLSGIFDLVRQFRIRLALHKTILKSLVKMGIVYALTTMLLQWNYKVDVLILKKMVSLSDVGFYSLGVSITEQLWLLPYAMGVVLMSRTANATNQDQILETTARLLRFAFPLAILGGLIMAALTPFLLPLIFGSKFIPSIQVVQAILPGIVIFMVFRILESYFAGLGKPWISMAFLLPSLVVNIGLNLWWIPKYGILGSAWATNISYLFATLLCVFTLMRMTGLSLSKLFLLKKEDITLISNHLRNWRSKKIGGKSA
jgi:O-antigen/teichoic acid export membrane protein